MIKARDYDYTEVRLLAPCSAAYEALHRLRAIGEAELALELTEAMRVFHDSCREIRRKLTDNYIESHQVRSTSG